MPPRKALGRRGHRAAAPQARQGRRASSCTCSRGRTCAWAAARPRTQYQYTLAGREPRRAPHVGAARCSSALREAPAAQGRRTPISRPRASSSTSTIDRDTASRARHHAAERSTTRSTTRSASARSRRPTRSSNQYRVVLEVKPELAATARRARRQSTCASPERRAGAAPRPSPRSAPDDAALGQPPGAVPRGHALVQPRRPASRSARRSTPSTRAELEIRLPAERPRRASRAPRRPSRPRSRTSRCSSLAALLAVYIVLGDALRELRSTRSRSSRRCPRPASARCVALLLVCKTDFSIIALIGIILLIGIVKKNAIMMIDFAHRGGARRRASRPRDAIHKACLLRFRPILMTTLRRALRRAAARVRHRRRAPSCASRSASPSSAACSSRSS